MKIQVSYGDKYWFEKVEQIRRSVSPEVPLKRYIEIVRYQVYTVEVDNQLKLDL